MADLEDYTKDAGTALFNAALIAAALEHLLSAVRCIESAQGWDRDHLVEARLAIYALAKARGES